MAVVETQLKDLKQDNVEIKTMISNINTKLDNGYVRKEEFVWVQRLVYSLVAVICLSVIGVLVRSVLQ